MLHRFNNAAQHTQAMRLQRDCGNQQVGRLLLQVRASATTMVGRQAATGAPGGPDPCLELLQQIIELLNEVAGRINDALDDRHDLFGYHRRIRDAHPDHGSWDGHRDRFYYERDRLRQKLAEWDSNDDCRGRLLRPQEQRELDESREFKEREFPERPANAMRESTEESPGLRERIANALRRYGVPAFAIGALVVLIVAALADPEPFSKVALLVGTAAAVLIFIAIGRAREAPPSA